MTFTEVRQGALQALVCPNFEEKCALVAVLIDFVATDFEAKLKTSQPLAEPTNLPGRPAKPELLAPQLVPRRSVHTREGRAALVHAIAHIEFNAINLALDAVWRFAGMPSAYYRQWLTVAHEEAKHFQMLRQLLLHMGFDYGQFSAHNGLWDMTEKTKGDITARMALVPRTLEARGLDATPLIQAKLRKLADAAKAKPQKNDPNAQDDCARATAILDVILADEIGHVAIGNHWYRWLCERQGLEPVAHYAALTKTHEAPKLKPPFNVDARVLAGFDALEVSALGS